MSEYIIDMGNSSYQSASGLLCADVSQLREEIVRCHDCKHYDRMNDDEGMCMVPDDDGDYARWIVDAVGYCYLGERRGRMNELEMVHDWHRPMEENPYCDVKTASLPPKYQWTCSNCGEVVYRDCSEGKPPADGCIYGTPKEEDE